MKKFLLGIATVLCIVLMFCCCNENKVFESDIELIENSDLEIVTQSSEYSKDTKKVVYTITNKADKESSCSAEGFSLQKLEDGVWMTVGFKKTIGFNALAQVLALGEKTQREIDLNEYFHLPLEKGEYRIIVDYTASNTFLIN